MITTFLIGFFLGMLIRGLIDKQPKGKEKPSDETL